MNKRDLFLSLVAITAMTTSTGAQDIHLPNRETPIPQTTNGVPHLQIGLKSVPAFSDELLRRVSKFPGVSIGATRVSLPGGIGFQFDDDLQLAYPEVIVGGREFAHLHTDGSLHASLNPDVALVAIEAGWAVSHPWAKQRDGWDGFVMIFTPTTPAELEVVIQLVESSYEFITGHELPQ